MTHQYSTPDGSIWVESEHEPGHFNRIAGKGCGMDFRAQRTFEVLRSWGPLSLYDAAEHQVRILTEAFDDATWFGCKSLIVDNGGPKLLFSCLDEAGYEIVRKDRDDD